MQIVRITSLDVPELEPYSTLREQTQHWRKGFFVAESEKVVRQLLASNCEIVSLLLSEKWFEELRVELEAERYADACVFIAPVEMLEGITGYKLHKSLMAIGRIPNSIPLDDFPAGPGKIFVALEAIADAENMGMILRNCAAFGVDGLIIGNDSCSPWLRRSVRVSVGTIFGLHIHYCTDIVTALETLRHSRNCHLVGTAPRGGMPTLTDNGMSLCLVFGSEAHGLSERTFNACMSRFTIPMHGGVDSINVANSIAVALYEATRNRT